MHCFLEKSWRASAAGRLIMLFLFLFALAAPPSGPARVTASSPNATIQVTRSEAKQAFPDSITFVLSAASDASIDRVTLVYGVVTDSCLSSQARQQVKVEPAASINADWLWDLKRSGNLPPGVKVWWQWEIHAADGTSLTTDAQEITIEDRGFTWKKRSQGRLTLYWAEGDYAFGQQMLGIAASSLDRLGKNAGLAVDTPIELRLYPSAEDMRDALVRISEWAGGVAFPEYNITLIGLSPLDDPSWAASVIPHELAHLVTGMRIFNCLNNDLPHWFNEGLSEYAEGPVPGAEVSAVLDALKRDTLPGLTSLNNGFPADSRKADLAYNQSRVMVSYIIEQYGPEKLEALLDLIRDGVNSNEALRRVYGLDIDDLDQTWRAEKGYGSAPVPSFATRTSAASVTVIPTIALWSPFGTETPAPTNTAVPATDAAEVNTAVPRAATAAFAVETVSVGTTATVEKAAQMPPARTAGLLNSVTFLIAAAGLILVAGLALFLIHSRSQPKS